MEARLQRRVQRYGWDLAAADYDDFWQAPLAPVRDAMLASAAPRPGERVLDVACGTGAASLPAARAVGPRGEVVGVDVSQRMVDAARAAAVERQVANARFERMDGETLALPDGAFDVALCGFGLMYMPEPAQCLRELRRVLRPGGRIALAVWGERARCAWAAAFEVIEREVASDVCPLFFRTGQGDHLARLCSEAGFTAVAQQRMAMRLDHADGQRACDAVLVGGPVALAWSRLGPEARRRVQRGYLDAIAGWREGEGYRLPAEGVVASALTGPIPARA